ncbi:MAG: type III-B CRISPR module-associated protein Cmr5 [Calditrichaeota bacterium]|nr:MAG: type III-B CRISPR module-associated protein Cmr5 [Calditrichota bacterium]
MKSETTILKGIEQGRAKFAYDKVMEAKTQLKEKAPNYKQYAKKIPAMIKTNGLGATLVFMGSKAKDKNGNETAYGVLLNHIFEWLKKDSKPLYGDVANLESSTDLPGYVVSLASPQYRAMTLEVLAFVNWVRRFADGMIEGETSDGD